MSDRAKQRLACGSWPTPITSEAVVADAVRLAEVAADEGAVIWSEGRPAEAGRTALVRRDPDGTLTELLPEDLNARTAVHEYGGGAWWARGGVVWFANWSDQRLYRRDPATRECTPLTPEPEVPRGDRYADGAVSPDGSWMVCVREHHPPDGRGAIDVRNEIVRLDAGEPSPGEVLVSGPDFVSNPRFSPDGQSLCWLEWDHPNMPWDGTRLMVRDLASGEERQIAGGAEESVSEPQWRPDGSLTFISDRSEWWNLYRHSPDGQVEPLTEIEAEIGTPQWVFGVSRYEFLDDGRILFARSRDGFDGLAVRWTDGGVADLKLPFTLVRSLAAAGGSSVVVVAGSTTEEACVSQVTLPEAGGAELQTLRPSRDLTELGVDPEYISIPESLDFPSAGRTSHALLYPPRNPSHEPLEGELPPLYVHVHGGPTSSARSELSLDVQYLTSRGFVVIDLNYGGSTGYGRPYRELLNGSWGIVDVEDAAAVARHLAEAGRVDPQRMCIGGGSAGGFTTLACLARTDTPFGAGGDLYGVADLEALTEDTHKFESRYLDRMVGPYPEAREIYRERSPIYHVDDFSRPLIVLQGLEDEVVPPNQATMIVDALRAKQVPVAYVAFAGEQHGFRQAANIRRALDSELSFFAQIFGFELPEEEGIEPVAIDG
ncbi:MAG TPA: prolyl oligopeptidase family serine peptidase [Solirubrobacteraceae bacterium]|nr:prolyl oligopeptidase family serine peptidase [Solirubrobacteraceae bacterium]